jgi:hypothetical protein
MRLQKAVRTSVVILDVTEPRHPKTMKLWHEVRSPDADSTDQLRPELPCDMQVELSPQRLQIPRVSCLPAV